MTGFPVNRCRELDCESRVFPAIFAYGSIDAAKAHGFSVEVDGIDDKRDLDYLGYFGVTGSIVDHPRKFWMDADEGAPAAPALR